MFVVHSPPPLADWVLFIAFGRFSMDGSIGRVAQSCRPIQKFFDHFHHKILLLQPLLLLNQAVVGNVGIHSYQIKYMEHDWHPNAPAPKRMTVISNQLV